MRRLLFSQNTDVEVRWRPYQLNPQAAQAGTNKLEYYKQKFGEQRTASIIPAMKACSAWRSSSCMHGTCQ